MRSLEKYISPIAAPMRGSFACVVLIALLWIQGVALAQTQADHLDFKKWDYTKGWHGVVPGKSSLKNAEAILGPVDSQSSDKGKLIYKFSKGVEVELNSATLLIERIKVTDAVCPDAQFPVDEKAAQEMYGPHQYESVGVRATYSKGKEPHLIALEFKEVKIIDDSPFLYPPGKYH